jgi:transcriptional regulator with XRE-family HTH domain
VNESFSKRLKRLRESKNLSATEMARRIQVPATTYREWEYGRGAKFPPFLKISQVLAISVTELVTGEVSNASIAVAELEAVELHVREIRLKLLAMGFERTADF